MNQSTKDVFLAVFFNDITKVKELLAIHTQFKQSCLLDLEGSFFNSEYIKIPVYQITMLLDSFWRNKSTLHGMLDCDLQILKGQIIEMLQFWKDYYCISELEEMNYNTWVTLIFAIDPNNDEVGIDYKTAENFGVTKRDALLISKCYARNKEACISLLQQGANPFVTHEDEFYGAMELLEHEESFQFPFYWELFDQFTKEGYTPFHAMNDEELRGMFATLYGVGSTSELIQAIETYSVFKNK